uniref:CRAL-TRIO domain-containing protein n=1 Tax=Araucaria cunninghamii TaxID=56994 RepID=A0A0D6R3Y5_ARACU
MDQSASTQQNGTLGDTNLAQSMTDEDRNKIISMREIIQKADSNSEVVDDPTLRRFLYARESDVQNACNLYLKYRKWRQTFVPFGYVSERMISNELKKNLVSMQGFDKKGRPIAVIHLARHKPCHKTIEDLKRLFVYVFDKMSSSASRGQGKFCIIADLDGWTYKNVDIHGCLAVLEILQDYYPERLGKVFVIHMPYIFWAAWNIVYPFIDRRTREKVLLIDNKHIQKTLLKDIDESQLPEIYGGKLPLVPVQDAVIPNWSSN